MNDVHSCSYFCQIPACIKRQRDEMRDTFILPSLVMLTQSQALAAIAALDHDHGSIELHELKDALTTQIIHSPQPKE